MILIVCLVLAFSSLASAQFTLITFFGYPAPKQAVYDVITPSPTPSYPPQQPPQQPYPYCPPTYAPAPAPVPIYPVYPVFAGPAIIYPQPQPYPVYPQPYPYQPSQPYPYPTTQPQYPPPGYTTTTTTLPPGPALTDSPDMNNQNAPLRSSKQQAYPLPPGTYVPIQPGMRPGQAYSIPIIGRIEFTALTVAGNRVEGIAGSNRVEGLSKQRYYVVNDTLVDFTQVKELEVRWTPNPTSQQSFMELNARRIFVSGVKLTDNGPVKTNALFSRCGRSTEMEAIKNYHFQRGCFKFSPEDQSLIDYFKGSGLLCEEMDPPVTNKKCIEDESKDYVRLYSTAPPVTIAPSTINIK